MNEASADTNNDSAPDRTWSPLNPAQRRVFGVLIEKAKTTPDAYPLTLNATTTGCNQKSNRAPQTDYETDDVQETLDSLRQLRPTAIHHRPEVIVRQLVRFHRAQRHNRRRLAREVLSI